MSVKSMTMSATHVACIRLLVRSTAGALLGATLMLAGCRDGVPSFLRTDPELQYNVVGGERLAVPANYIDSQSYGSILVMASWPEMEGRTNENYEHFAESNISIHARPGGPKALDASYRIFLMGEGKGGKQLKATGVGSAYGFEHSVIQFKGGNANYTDTHRDIYVRRNTSGRLQAVMRCNGEPAPEGRNPQCQLFEIFPEFPQIEFKINFDRSEALDQVNAIERAVREKFLQFKAAGDRAYVQDPVARDEFIRIEKHLESEKIKFIKGIEGRCRTSRGLLGDLNANGECK